MPESLTYEIYIRRGQEWIVESASDCRATALEDAQRLFDTRVSPAVKVIEERFSADTGSVTGATIFLADRSRPAPRGPQVQKPRQRRQRPPGKPVIYKRQKSPLEIFVQRLILILLVVGGLSLSVLVSVAHLLDYAM